MKKQTTKIVVLTDLKKSMGPLLRSTIGLSKMVNGNIELLHVKKMLDVVKKENQLSAIRSMNHEYAAADKKIQKTIKTFSEEYGVPINCSLSFGNLKGEISEFLKKHQPDIVVLGRKRSKTLDVFGDNIAQYILGQYDGTLLIVDNKKAFEPNKDLSLGVLNNSEKISGMAFTNELIGYSQKPLTSFKIVKNSNKSKESNVVSKSGLVEYVFEHNSNSIKTLSKYLTKNNINLLCVDRMDNSSTKNQNNKRPTTIVKDIIGQLDVSLFLTGKQKVVIQ